MLVEYVGKKVYHSDRFFGSGQHWDGAGDTKEVDDATAKRMVSLFPSLYAQSTGSDTRLHAADSGHARDRKDATRSFIDLHDVAESDGRVVTLREASRIALLGYAKDTLGIQTKPTTSKVDLLAMIVGHLELGAKGAAQAGAGAAAEAAKQLLQESNQNVSDASGPAPKTEQAPGTQEPAAEEVALKF